jgi:DNA polymerase I-like protein with 3'-5' exonuclease and polymerase domains
VHTTFTFDTAIGQLSSRNPNTQNFVKLKPTPALAKAMRAMIAAQPGNIITEWDYKSCHVITLGFLAEDLNYMRLGRLDIHSFVAGHVLGLWDGFKIFSESDEELLGRFRWLKSDPERKRVRDDQAKHAILGIGNGLKERGLYERYMEEFGNQKTAKRFLDICGGLFPKVFEWQERIVRQAHDARQLKTQFGHIRRFYEVFRWDHKRGDWAPGDQHEQAISFWLSNIAFGHIREGMKELARRSLDEKYGLFNTVHDSLMFHFPRPMLEEHTREVHAVLAAPSKVLRHPTICPAGLVIDVEASWGENWADMHEITLPKSTPPKVECPREESHETTIAAVAAPGSTPSAAPADSLPQG